MNQFRYRRVHWRIGDTKPIVSFGARSTCFIRPSVPGAVLPEQVGAGNVSSGSNFWKVIYAMYVACRRINPGYAKAVLQTGRGIVP